MLADCLFALPIRGFAAEDKVLLRPHHLVDILTSHGAGEEFKAHPYGHSLHLIGPRVLGNLALEVKFVAAADSVCHGCVHLHSDGSCDDVLSQLPEKPSKQKYNDDLDRRLMVFLPLREGACMTVRAFFELVSAKTPGIEKLCTHPKEDQAARLRSLLKGLHSLGVRNA